MKIYIDKKDLLVKIKSKGTRVVFWLVAKSSNKETKTNKIKNLQKIYKMTQKNLNNRKKFWENLWDYNLKQ